MPIEQNSFILYQYSYMFRPREVIIRLPVERFKKNIQIGTSGYEISLHTQYTHNFCISFQLHGAESFLRS